MNRALLVSTASFLHYREGRMNRALLVSTANFFPFLLLPEKVDPIFMHDQLFTDKPINCNLPSLTPFELFLLTF